MQGGAEASSFAGRQQAWAAESQRTPRGGQAQALLPKGGSLSGSEEEKT